MKIKSAEFETSAPTIASAPRWTLPEFAFIGRSNVGKSSLINLLTERNALAKASVTPGKTKLINFFRINTNWCLVDLPGYGYAKVNREDRADFNVAVANYIEKRDVLVHLFVLIDSRLTPQKIDLEFLNWLSTIDVAFSLVFTKTDKVSMNAVESNVALFKSTMKSFMTVSPKIFTSSSTTKRGRKEILDFIEAELARDKASA
ncbi:ribosome biogenesis GTP-binding protein YihA/YsxC [Rariglobus hedericola]|uniref:Probable GTP-binding protein EngB n=1 Tax=Rariglobus hedericola TaxID=2597822 RepID=A0A556QS66_9BACT|nr:ribosome biogenesis GTP-binding protein YihA/YsxC [Rariglobus hedericola]TSJ79486.1 YihA family ribosome biogenesis GTP-binding protein [Rariglobus hedericola]